MLKACMKHEVFYFTPNHNNFVIADKHKYNDIMQLDQNGRRSN